MHVQNPLFESFPIFVASSIVSGKGFPKVSGRNMANVPATEATTPIITIIAKLLGMYPIRIEQIPPTRAAGKSQNTTYNIEEGSCHIFLRHASYILPIVEQVPTAVFRITVGKSSAV